MRHLMTLTLALLVTISLTACGGSTVKEEAALPAPTEHLTTNDGSTAPESIPTDTVQLRNSMAARVMARVRIVPVEVIETMRDNGCRMSGLQYTESFDEANITVSCAPVAKTTHASPATPEITATSSE